MPQNCLYCHNKAVLDSLMIKIANLEVSTLYLFKEQSHSGRCVEHIGHQQQIPEADWLRFMQDVRHAAEAIEKASHPLKRPGRGVTPRMMRF